MLPGTFSVHGVFSVWVFTRRPLLFPESSSLEFRVPEFPSYTLPGEQPVQLNTAPIYICVYTRLLPILSLRIIDLINNKKLFRCSPVHSPSLNKWTTEQHSYIHTRIYAPLFIPFRRFFNLINNKKLFSCSLVHSPAPENRRFIPPVTGSDR